MQTRIVEGEHLRDDLIEKLDGMLKLVDFIAERSPQIVQEYRQKLEDKVKDLLGDAQVDENRLLTEVTIFADKGMCGRGTGAAAQSYYDHEGHSAGRRQHRT